MVVTPSEKDARTSLQALVGIGLALGVIGGAVAAAAWPGEEVTSFGSVHETGNVVLAIIGAAIAWVGNSMLLVGLVGHGVALGREASPDRNSPSAGGITPPDVPS